MTDRPMYYEDGMADRQMDYNIVRQTDQQRKDIQTNRPTDDDDSMGCDACLRQIRFWSTSGLGGQQGGQTNRQRGRQGGQTRRTTRTAGRTDPTDNEDGREDRPVGLAMWRRGRILK